MFHGEKDDVVPISFSRKVLAIFKKAKKKLFIIEKGDHSLSDIKAIKLIKKELSKIIEDIF